MHWIEKIHKLYFKLPDFHQLGLAGKLIDKLLARLVKSGMDRWLPAYYLATIDDYHLVKHHEQQSGEPRIICSLTSFPARIQQVWIAIESLFRQTRPADKIILWLSEEQFPDRILPDNLLQLQAKGLEINYCAGDMKAHKKYLYTLAEYPNDLVITYDDDLYYDRQNIENLLAIYRRTPAAIGTNRAHKIGVSARKGVLPYRKWQHNVSGNEVSHQLLATGGYGTLYQRDLLAAEVTNEDLIRELSFYADDMWLKCMALLHNTPVATNTRYGKDPIPIGESQREKLVTTNVLSGGNDTQLRALMNHFTITPDHFTD